MKRSPSDVEQARPSPRSASESRNRGVPGTVITVGMELHELEVADRGPGATSQGPRRRRWRSADWWSRGRCVRRRRWPAALPPARTSATPPVVHDSAHRRRRRARRPDRRRGRRARSRTPALAAARSHSTRPISRPVASWAWSTRLHAVRAFAAERERRPSGSRSKAAPHSASSATRPGPSSTRTRTASARHRPSPAAIVSAACSAGESSRPTAAAMPPWA